MCEGVLEFELATRVLRLVVRFEVVDGCLDLRRDDDRDSGVRWPRGSRQDVDIQIERLLLAALFTDHLVRGHLLAGKLDIAEHLLQVGCKARTTFCGSQ